MIFVTGDCHGDFRKLNKENFPEQKEMTKDDYVIIFETNKKQIKDPNKIYVGQVFSVIKKDSKTFKSMKKSKK